MDYHNLLQDSNLLFLFITIIFTQGTCNPSGFKNIRDNIVLGWLLLLLLLLLLDKE